MNKKIKSLFLCVVIIIFCAFILGVGIGVSSQNASAEELTRGADSVQDNSSVDLSSEEETSQDSENESVTEPPVDDTETPEYDLDDFLEWVQGYADKAGLGNEFKEAVDAIKTAASEKQVTMQTIMSVGVFAVIVVLIIVENVRKKNFIKQLAEMAERLKAQTDGTNGLIDESNANGKAVAETKEKTDAITVSLKHLTKGLSVLANRTNIGAAYKEQIQEEFNAAEKSLGGAADESNKA